MDNQATKKNTPTGTPRYTMGPEENKFMMSAIVKTTRMHKSNGMKSFYD
jgi:hypothetical protein